MTTDTVVVKALAAEYVRMRNKLRAAASRLAYAHQQAELEDAMVREHGRDLDMLADALLSSGGTLPPEEEDAAAVAVRMAR